ncbi:MAG TPA: HAMP domain-containing sensor histidine kinase [Hyphomicrobiaceae bacterium]|nr:HAMP domain-containing sensor histidine kinase [Hyphomicrobiaceae bacterium]
MTRRIIPLALMADDDSLASALPAFVIDAAAGTIVAANAAGRRAWGPGPGSRRGSSVAEVASIPIDRAMPALGRLAALSRTGAAETLLFWTAHGLLRLCCRVEPSPGASGRYLVQALPESAAPAGQAERARAFRAAPVGDTDEARQAALARLAHEVRTPLGAAIAYAEVLAEERFGPLGNARYRDYARTIHDSARHALSVLDGMLSGATDPDGTGLPELAFTDLDPARIIDNCIAVARPLAERAGLALVAHVHRGTPRVIADEVSLKQMLLNLITNAIKFARPGDQVALSAAYGADGCLRMEVADTGPGMDVPAELDAATTVPLHEHAVPWLREVREPRNADLPEAPACHAAVAAGQGIGLPLTRALAKANGATLVVHSTPGRGTRVTIVFAKDRVVPV